MPLSVTNLVGFGAKRSSATGTGSVSYLVDITDNADGTFTVPASASSGDLAIVVEYTLGNSVSPSGTSAVPSGWTLPNDGTSDFFFFNDVFTDEYVTVYYKVLSSGDINTPINSAYTSESQVEFNGVVYAANGNTITVSSENDWSAEDAANAATQNLNASGSSNVIYIGHVTPFGQFSASWTPDSTVDQGAIAGASFLFAATGANETWDDDGSGGAEQIASGWLGLTLS